MDWGRGITGGGCVLLLWVNYTWGVADIGRWMVGNYEEEAAEFPTDLCESSMFLLPRTYREEGGAGQGQTVVPVGI